MNEKIYTEKDLQEAYERGLREGKSIEHRDIYYRAAERKANKDGKVVIFDEIFIPTEYGLKLIGYVC